MNTPRNPSQIRRRRLLRGIGGFALILGVVGAVIAMQHREQATANPGEITPSDSTTIALSDSAAADSTQAPQQQKKKGGLLGFLNRSAAEENKENENKEDKAVPVEMASVERRDVPSYFTGTATVEAEQRVSVLAKIAGTVGDILVEEGDPLQENQVLLQIDDAEQKARLEELQVRAQGLQREYERTQSLLAKDLASDREFEDKKLLMEEAKAKLMVGEIQLGYTKVRAPFDGRVTQRHVHVGEYVQVNQVLFDIADFDPLLVRVYMPEREVDRVQEGQKVRIIPDALEGDSYAGRVRMISPVVDTRSGTVKVTIELNERTDHLRLGAFVRVQITTDVHRDAIVVPKIALVEEGGETFVYRAEADSVLKVRVQPGFSDESWTEVLVGLTAGDRVVTVGQGGLKHGSRVRELLPAETTEAVQKATDDEADLARR